MSEYKRFVSYVYEYQNHQKGPNRGFLKVECRSGTCQMGVSLRGVCRDDNGTAKIYGFRRTASRLQGTLLKQEEVKSGTLSCQLAFPENEIGDQKYGINELSGVILLCGNDFLYATQWDDEPLDFTGFPNTAPLQPEIPQSVESGKLPDRESGKTPSEEPDELPTYETAETPVGKTEEIPPHEHAETPAAKSAEAPIYEHIETPGDKAAEIPPIKLAKTPAAEPAETPAAEHAETPTYEPTEAPIYESTEAPIYEPAEASGDKAAKIPPIELAETLAAEYAETPAAEPPVKESEESSRQQRFPESTETELPVTVLPESPSAAEQPTGIDAGELHAETTAEHTSPKKNIREASIEITSDECSKEIIHKERSMKNIPKQKPWFRDGFIVHCTRITVRDICRLHPSDWYLSNNRFVLYGQQTFGHLLVGRLGESGQTVLCVPGIYHQQERALANMYGFSCFAPCPGHADFPKGFGYWYRLIQPADPDCGDRLP